MRRYSSALALLLLWSAAYAYDNGQYNNVDPKIRQWFKSVRSPNGVPCCDIADGHRTTWRPDSSGGYEVLIEGEWYSVPKEAVVKIENPVGEAVVWFGRVGGVPVIRCFVPEALG